MEESAAPAAKPMPPGSTTRAANGCDRSKPQTSPEAEPLPAGRTLSPLKKTIKPPESMDVFDTITSGASKEISVVFSKFAQALTDQAAADASRMEELEGILAEARDLESYLKEKKQHLRQMLAVISDKLQC